VAVRPDQDDQAGARLRDEFEVPPERRSPASLSMLAGQRDQVAGPSSSFACASSCSRPMKLVSGLGRLIRPPHHERSQACQVSPYQRVSVRVTLTED